jgi:hypothetical protein
MPCCLKSNKIQSKDKARVAHFDNDSYNSGLSHEEQCEAREARCLTPSWNLAGREKISHEKKLRENIGK